MNISLRPTCPDDEEFLYRVYASTRQDEVSAWGWNQSQQEAFLKMQFNAQQRAYEWQFPGAEHSVILCDGEMAGRLIIVRTDREIRLTDITLLPEYRRRGAGTFLITDLQAQARAAGRPLRLRVSRTNEAARRLYERLNFSLTGESDIHFMMEWLSGDA
jgi:ribosomal protein S18 acetylase RimI-like enzyme